MPVGPVSEDVVNATLPHLPPPVAAMVKLQLLTGARGGELMTLRPCDIDMARDVWRANLAVHKTAHHGHARTLMFGPKAQAVLLPFLTADRTTTAYLFNPAESMKWKRDRQKQGRKTPMTAVHRVGRMGFDSCDSGLDRRHRRRSVDQWQRVLSRPRYA